MKFLNGGFHEVNCTSLFEGLEIVGIRIQTGIDHLLENCSKAQPIWSYMCANDRGHVDNQRRDR